VTQCSGSSDLLLVKTWNENSLEAKIETQVNSLHGITCSGVLGTGRLVPWEKVTYAKSERGEPRI